MTELTAAAVGHGHRQVAPAGAIREIVTRGYHAMQGYFDNPGATSEAIGAGGWLHTGDLGSAAERGYYRIEGRLKQVITRGGEDIYPGDRAGRVRSPGSRRCGRGGVPDDR